MRTSRRPRLSTSAIEKQLKDVVAEYPHLDATAQLTRAMRRSFEDMVRYFVDVVSSKMVAHHTSSTGDADAVAMTALVRKVFALVKLGGNVSIRDFCGPEDRDRLTAAALCFPAEASGTVRFDEPLLREVVTRVGYKFRWELSHILHELLRRDLNSTADTTTGDRSYQLERIFALQMSQRDGMIIADFLAPFVAENTVLPEWTARSTLEFSTVHVGRSDSVREDLTDISQVLDGEALDAARDRSLWLPCDRLRPDVLSINLEHGYILLCGVRWRNTTDSVGPDRDSDLASLQSSVTVNYMGLQKSGCETRKKESEGMRTLREGVVGRLLARKREVKEGRPLNELRVACVLPGICSHNDNVNGGGDDDERQQQGVKVGVDGRTVTLVINKHNFHHFFEEDVVRAIRMTVGEQRRQTAV